MNFPFREIPFSGCSGLASTGAKTHSPAAYPAAAHCCFGSALLVGLPVLRSFGIATVPVAPNPAATGGRAFGLDLKVQTFKHGG